MMTKNASEKTDVWERTTIQCPQCNDENQSYYGRIRIYGKQK